MIWWGENDNYTKFFILWSVLVWKTILTPLRKTVHLRTNQKLPLRSINLQHNTYNINSTFKLHVQSTTPSEPQQFTIVRLQIIGLLVTFAADLAEVGSKLLMNTSDVTTNQRFVVSAQEHFPANPADRLKRQTIRLVIYDTSPVVIYIRVGWTCKCRS